MVSPAKGNRSFAVGEHRAGIIVTGGAEPLGPEAVSAISTRPASRKEEEDVMSRKFSSGRPLTDAEEAEIQRMIASDPDNPELTDGQIAGLRPFAEVLPALAESAKRSPGRPKLEKTLEPVTLRLDPSVVEHFRAQGADWRKRMARVLAKAAT